MRSTFPCSCPLFEQIKGLAQEILEMNQANMSEANDAARSQADSAQRRMTIAILSCAVVAILFSLLAQRWILDPIRRLIESANEIRRGNLELVLNADSRDEIGQLSEAFNAMAEGLRHTRRSDRRDLMRTRQAVSEVFKALPAAIAVLDLEDRVEVATEPAETFFGLKPGVRLKDLGYEWLTALVRRAQDEGRIVENTAGDACIQIFRDNREYFFSPVVVPIVVESGRREISGTAVILKDVTSLREQQELKRSAVTTVSHQLRNPLTSIRMSVHLLLEETLGPLNARADRAAARCARGKRAADRHRRGASGPQPHGIRQEPCWTSTAFHRTQLVRDAVEPFLVEAKDKGIRLDNTVPGDLPEVLGDSKTAPACPVESSVKRACVSPTPGGAVSVSAEAETGMVRFAVTDTGAGIAAEHLAGSSSRSTACRGRDSRPVSVWGLPSSRKSSRPTAGVSASPPNPGRARRSGSRCRRTAGAATPAVDVALTGDGPWKTAPTASCGWSAVHSVGSSRSTWATAPGWERPTRCCWKASGSRKTASTSRSAWWRPTAGRKRNACCRGWRASRGEGLCTGA